MDTKTITGQNSLYIDDAKRCNAVKYNVDGVCVQDGTPTPDSPVEVENIPSIINYLGLIKGSTDTVNDVTITITEDGYVKLNGTASANINKNYNWAVSGSTYTSTPYTYSSTYVSGTKTTTGNQFFIINARSGATQSDVSNQFNPTYLRPNETIISTTFTPSNSGYITGIQLMASSGVVFDNYICKLQLEEGSIAHEYVPHGYWSKVKVTGKNMFNGEFQQGTINFGSNGANSSSTIRIRTDFILVCVPFDFFDLRTFPAGLRGRGQARPPRR